MTRTLRSSVTCALAVLAATTAVAGSARAQIMGDLPTIVVQRDGGDFSYEVTGLMATKGIVQAQVSDRFSLEVSAVLIDGGGVEFWASGPSKLPLIADKDASMKQGSEVSLTGVGQTLADPLAEPRPDPITLAVTVSLVLETGSDAEYVFDTIRVTDIVSPRDS